MAHRKKGPVDGPMGRLGQLVQQAGLRLKSGEPPAANQDQTPQKQAPVPDKVPEQSDEELFSSAMHTVNRAAWRHDPHFSVKTPQIRITDAEAENRKLMQEAMDEEVPLAIPDHPEYIEGWIGVAGQRLLPNLRNGLYSIQGQMDLHGMNQAEAQMAVEEYILDMSRTRPCCIKIIHGRGINSPADRATLKDSLQRLLTTRKMSKYVLAYASAAYRDGGVGAVYVLLCRQ